MIIIAKMKSLIIILITTILLLGCNNPQPQKIETNLGESLKKEVPDTDTMVDLTINNQLKHIRFLKDVNINYEKFRSFLYEYSNKPFLFKENIVDDFTGDGVSDTLTNIIELTGNVCSVFALIRSQGQLVFADTLIIPDSLGNVYEPWGYGSTYKQLFPYSLFYDGILNKLKFYNSEQAFYYNPPHLEMFKNYRSLDLKSEGYDSVFIENRINQLDTYVRNYKGLYIANLSLIDSDLYIYDSLENKFVIFYCP